MRNVKLESTFTFKKSNNVLMFYARYKARNYIKQNNVYMYFLRLENVKMILLSNFNKKRKHRF